MSNLFKTCGRSSSDSFSSGSYLLIFVKFTFLKASLNENVASSLVNKKEPIKVPAKS